MKTKKTHAVTGALGYSGRYIARRLLEAGHEVVSLTNSQKTAEGQLSKVRIRPFWFDDPAGLEESLGGVEVLYNTYWVRFNHAMFTHADAVKNTLALFDAAKRAGVQRVVHISITNPSLASDLEYFREKAYLEEALKATGMSYAILRPAVIFGREDILINNIAWFVRRFPVFGVFGDGSYRIQPIYVDDLAALAIREGQGIEDVIIDAIGPETFTYRGLAEMICRVLEKRRPIVSISPRVGYLLARVVGGLMGDVVITRPEIEGLMRGLLCVESPPVGTTILTEWAKDNARELGRHYHSELARRRPARSCDVGGAGKVLPEREESTGCARSLDHRV